MLTLGIETATSVCSVALTENGKIISEKSLLEKNVHSEKIISLIDDVLKGNDSFDRIAISIGPGSFTGLRVGLSTAKGLSYASKKPIIPVPTLKALSYNLILYEKVKNVYVLPLLDARRDEFYWGLYKISGNDIIEIISPKPSLFAQIIENLQPEEEYSLIGEGTEKFEKLLKSKLASTKNLKFYSSNVNFCSAASVSLVSENVIIDYDTDFIAKLEPMYLKDFHTLVK